MIKLYIVPSMCSMFDMFDLVHVFNVLMYVLRAARAIRSETKRRPHQKRVCIFIHPKQHGPFLERLTLPHPDEEILSGFEEDVSFI